MPTVGAGLVVGAIEKLRRAPGLGQFTSEGEEGTVVEQTVISADTHMDIVWLPEDLFLSNAPDSLKDQMPRVVDTAEGRIWKAENTSFGFVAAGALTGSYEPYQPGKSKRLDRMEEMGFFSDADAGKFHPSTPELRLKDQDADGIKAEVIYGILGVSTGFSDAEGGLSSPEALTCVYDIYNKWAADFCKAAPDRLAALACISSHSPSIASAQLKRAADLGLKGAEMNVSSASSPIYQDEWNELWETAGECNMPISFHTVGLKLPAAGVGGERTVRDDLPWPDVHVVPAIGAGVHDERAVVRGMRSVPELQVRSRGMRDWVAALRHSSNRRGVRRPAVPAWSERHAQRTLETARLLDVPGRTPDRRCYRGGGDRERALGVGLSPCGQRVAGLDGNNRTQSWKA